MKTKWQFGSCLLVVALNVGAAELRNPHVRSGLEITAQGSAVVVAAGECEVAGHTVKVAAATTLPVAPGPVVHAADDPPYRLSAACAARTCAT
ncbi:MAG: hypothetical protein NTY53_08090 [Kiritimatiellaeota bacterium]|nr:hypothetical protein [Kiritimatiellota bacterium]